MAPIETEQLRRREVLLRVKGIFGADAASELGELVADAPPDVHLTVDFGKVSAFVDFALAMVARDLVAARARVTLRGLGQHQRRLLRYFGVDDEAPASAATRAAGDPPR